MYSPYSADPSLTQLVAHRSVTDSDSDSDSDFDSDSDSDSDSDFDSESDRVRINIDEIVPVTVSLIAEVHRYFLLQRGRQEFSPRRLSTNTLTIYSNSFKTSFKRPPTAAFGKAGIGCFSFVNS